MLIGLKIKDCCYFLATFLLPQSEINAGPSDGTELLQTENRLGHVFCFLLIKIATLII